MATRRRLTRPVSTARRKVLYFVDIYANWFDVQLAEAFLAVMEHNGARVYVHPQQQSSGMHLLSLGVIDRARRMAARNVARLAEAVRQGYTVVCTEPSAALALRHEYPQLLGTPDAQLVADNTSEACTYLWELHRKGNLELDLQPLNATVGYHLPCHLRALEVGTPGENLLRLVPGLTVRRIEKGCSGMAGLYGLKRENYRASLRAGWGLISALRSPTLQAGTTECSTCKMQMEQGTTKPTLHPIKLLALAYGRMPELAGRLHARGEELVVT
jgi:Fe-S oxidoreductase